MKSSKRMAVNSFCERMISHVLQAIGLDEEHAAGTIRISLGKNNTEQDVERIASALNKIVKEST